MSGEPEIEQWFLDNEDLWDFSVPVESLYNQVNQNFVDNNRNDLDNVLLDQRSQFIRFLQSRIDAQIEPEFDPQVEFSPQITAALEFLFG